LAIALLAWHVYVARGGGSRPTTLERDTVLSYRVDLNRADLVELMQLPGVGENLARRIEAYRQEHRGFRALDDLRQVGGIGPSLLERLRPLVCVEPYEAEEENEAAPPPVRPPPRPARNVAKPAAGARKKPELTEPIDVNRASPAELQRLPGIGPKLSERIVLARQQAPFRSVDELRRVPGIGAKTLENLRPHVTVSAGSKEGVRDD
jgi:competence protein ComEA